MAIHFAGSQMHFSVRRRGPSGSLRHGEGGGGGEARVREKVCVPDELESSNAVGIWEARKSR